MVCHVQVEISGGDGGTVVVVGAGVTMFVVGKASGVCKCPTGVLLISFGLKLFIHRYDASPPDVLFSDRTFSGSYSCTQKT